MCKKSIYLASFALVLGGILSSAANAADPSLVGWWRLDETSGTTAHDSSGSGNHGTLQGNPQWDAGMIGGAIHLDDESSDYVEIPFSEHLRVLNVSDFTHTAWANFDEVNRKQHVIMQTDRNGLGRPSFFIPAGGTIQSYLGMGGTNSGVRPVAGEWYHIGVVVTEGGALDSIQLYVNGQAAGNPGQWGIESCEGVYYIGRHKNLQTEYMDGLVDDVRMYNRSLKEAEIQDVMSGVDMTPALASKPVPGDGATDSPRDVVLSWTPGAYVTGLSPKHKIFFSENFDDVNDGIGGVTQDPNIYPVSATLDFSRTYYWRIDEANSTSGWDQGRVWQFTVEPIAYIIAGENITVTASSANRTEEGPENTVNGSGLDNSGLLHGNISIGNMWLSSGVDPNTAWIQYEFDRIRKLYQMWVWNYNGSVEPLVGFGIREAAIEYSLDGTSWVILGTTHEFAQGTGAADYAPNTTVDLSGVAAKYVRITANSNWGGILRQYGLSEVRFLYVPVNAREPSPDSGATDVGVDTTLSFRAGREAAKHDVYISTDEQAVIDGTVPVASVTEASYAPSLDLAGIYYWRIDEVNDAEIPTTWQGDIWNLSTQEYLVVEDFESYNDIPAGEEGSNLVYGTWADGFENPANGSTIGYNEPFQPTIETSLVYDGEQSVPLFYDNTVAAYSEVTANVADLDVGLDWAKHSIKALTLRFLGDPNNALQQMYVKINGSKVTYDGSAEDTRLTGWQMWYIDLASIGVSLSNVTELAIGFERIGAVGGKGMVLLDGIRLYSHDRQLITPAEPGTTGLQAHFEFEGNTNDSSGNARNGTAVGNPDFVAGKVGQAINLSGLNDYVEITGYKGILGSSAITVTAWIKTVSTDTGAIVGLGPNVAGERFGFRVDVGRLRLEHQGGNIQGDTLVIDGAWHHVAVTVQENATISYPEVILYLDGTDDTRPTTDPDAFNLTAGEDVRIGSRPSDNDRFFLGQIDEVRIYNGTLTQEEIAWLSGRTIPFDKPF